jgi:hypothetical protein
VDDQTGSRWDPGLGLATSGPLAGEAMRSIPSLTSYDWAWLDFYPESKIYAPPE